MEKKNCKATASEAMRNIIEQVKNVIDFRLETFDSGYDVDDEHKNRFKMENEVDRIEALKKICEAVTMMVEHIHNVMPYQDYVYADDGTIWEEKTLLKKLKKEQK